MSKTPGSRPQKTAQRILLGVSPKKNYGAHMFWELQAHDEGAPVCTSEGQLVGLAVTDPCYTLFGEEIEGAFPIVTLSDPETGKIRDDVVELFDTAGLSIADDGVPFIKE